jgi:hypothetical protein
MLPGMNQDMLNRRLIAFSMPYDSLDKWCNLHKVWPGTYYGNNLHVVPGLVSKMDL